MSGLVIIGRIFDLGDYCSGFSIDLSFLGFAELSVLDQLAQPFKARFLLYDFWKRQLLQTLISDLNFSRFVKLISIFSTYLFNHRICLKINSLLVDR
jgi:hypothetical protein